MRGKPVQDEHFYGWGGEDDAFCLAATTFSYVTRQPGVVAAIDHPVARRTEDPHWTYAGERMEIYRAIARYPRLLRKFIQEADLEPYRDFAPRRRRAR